LDTLDPWESNVFPELTMDVECYEFLELVNAQNLDETAVQLITVSDGSDDSGSMTFGWAIALPSGFRLACCFGPAYGPSGSSFEPKATGFSP
jgi:hypothetical protein